MGGTDRQAGIRGRAGFLFLSFFSLSHTGASWLPQQASIVAMEGLPAKHPWSLKYGPDLNMDSGLLFVWASGVGGHVQLVAAGSTFRGASRWPFYILTGTRHRGS